MSALMKTPLRQVTKVSELLMNEQAAQQMKMVATKALSPERMMRVVANAIRTTPKLQECEPMSFLGAMMFCASTGLEPNTPLGLAYLVPFNKNVPRKDAQGRDVLGSNGKVIWDKIPQAQVIIGYKGFKELARRTGRIKSMHGDIVYENDTFSHSYGSRQHLEHIPATHGGGSPIGAYFHVSFDGGEGHVFMSKSDIEAHRDRYSKGWQDAVREGKTKDSPWEKDWEAMWVKTCCRKLIGRGDIPISVEIADALAADEASIDFRDFAVNPMQGLPPADEPTGEVEADDGPAMVEEARTVSTTETAREAEPAKPARTAAPRQAKPTQAAPVEEDRKPDPVEEQRAPVEQQRQPETTQRGLALTGAAPGTATPSVDERLEASALCKMILRDLYDIGRDAVMDMHGEELNGLKRRDPELHARLMQDIENA